MDDSQPPRVSQSGAVGGHNIQIGSASGDVIVLLDRLVYRLEFLAPVTAPRAMSRSQRRQPSYLLDPQREIVKYRPRPEVEIALAEWLDEPTDDVSVLWLSGPGGQGKTRLAGRVATDRHVRGWAVAQATERSFRLRAGVEREPLTAGQPLLVVVDYAERWRLELLVELVEGLPLDFPERRVRVLMLARPGPSLWDGVAAELDKIGVDLAQPIVLGEFAVDRDEAFREAAVAFTEQIAPGRPIPSPPENLTDSSFASVLVLHMAALSAVCAGDAGETVPYPEDLSGYLLHHERRGWTAAARCDTTTAATIETTAWLATLFGPAVGVQAALALLQQARITDGATGAARLLAQYEQLYPPIRTAVQGKAGWEAEVATLQPLRPDRLGEDFVGTYLCDRPHAAKMLTNLLGHHEGIVGSGIAGLRRCLAVVAAAAARHAAAQEMLWAILRTRPTLATLAGALVLQTVVDAAPDDVADAVDRALPIDCSAELLAVAVDLAKRLLVALPADATPDERANRLNRLRDRDLVWRKSRIIQREEYELDDLRTKFRLHGRTREHLVQAYIEYLRHVGLE